MARIKLRKVGKASFVVTVVPTRATERRVPRQGRTQPTDDVETEVDRQLAIVKGQVPLPEPS